MHVHDRLFEFDRKGVSDGLVPTWHEASDNIVLGYQSSMFNPSGAEVKYHAREGRSSAATMLIV